MPYTLEQLGERYGAWWIDALGEHNHIGGLDSTRWLLERARLSPGDRMLDCGAFVGAAARHAAGAIPGLRVVATDINPEFLAAGREMEDGGAVDWVTAASERMPFASGSFQSVWALDTAMPPRELARVAAPRATLCLCCEAPNDNRGGAEAFFEEWEEYGWRLSAHRALSLEATNTWRKAEADVVWRHTFYEERYGKRGYGGQLDLLTSLVQMYERGEAGHGLYVFTRG